MLYWVDIFRLKVLQKRVLTRKTQGFAELRKDDLFLVCLLRIDLFLTL